ncbi:MAG TPA: tetratricopeptide repeat protein [Phototrophicaceae bacterium]|nr:tetratricopeptide repeat protein [Phototrophicaceae bacterium]
MAARRREWLALLLISMVMIGLPGRLLAQDATPEATPPGGLAAQLGLITVTEAPTSTGSEATSEATVEATAQATEIAAANCLAQVQFQQDSIGLEAQVTKLTKAIKADPQDIDSLMARADLYRSIQSYDLAIADYQQVLTTQPNYTDNQFACNYAITYALRGESSAQSSQYQAAFNDYQAALQVDATLPSYFPIYDLMGTASEGLGQYDQALKYFNQSIATLNYPQSYVNRAQLYMAGRLYPQAFSDLNTAIKLDNQNTAAYYFRSRLEATEGDFSSALTDASRVIALAPNSSSGYINRATIYRAQGDDQDALADLTQAISVDPSDPNAYLNRSYIYADEKQYDLALKDLNQTLQLAPNEPTVLTTRSEVYREQGNDPAALADANQVVQLDPTNPDSYLRRGYIYDDMNNSTAALADYNKAIQLDATYPWGYLARGSSYGKQGDRASEAADYWQFAQLDGTQALVQPEIQAGGSAQLAMQAGLVFHIPFEGKAGQVITIAANSPASVGVDSLLVLLDPNGKPIAADDDSGGDTNALISKVALPTSGTYTIIVTHAGGNNTGSVTVTLTVDQ